MLGKIFRSEWCAETDTFIAIKCDFVTKLIPSKEISGLFIRNVHCID